MGDNIVKIMIRTLPYQAPTYIAVPWLGPRTQRCKEVPVYSEKLPISEAKKKDLLNLCDLHIIPVEFHFHKQLIKAKMVSDTLPEPDETEE